MRPWVGIALGHDDQGRWRTGRDYVYGDLAYVRAVEAAGGIPIVLPIQEDPSLLVERIDALLLPGGDDFPPPPGRYPESVAFDLVSEPQRNFDAALLAAALERDLPTLGICYGA
ncbi:MAG: gamma-glutamyl-gamma-aminobutyrate hydrolase family protein, partial [Myxococcota bacterium]